jgi:hypothetical protein
MQKRKRTKATIALAAVSALIGILLITFRAGARSADDETSPGAFTLQIHVRARPAGPVPHVVVNLPADSTACRILAESFAHSGGSLEIRGGTAGSAREMILDAGSGQSDTWLRADIELLLASAASRGAQIPGIDDGPVREASDVEVLRAEATIRPRITIPSEATGGSILDLTRLPETMQESVVLMLLLPLGGLVTVIARKLLRVPTLGYFTASLLAISFTHTGWKTGSLVFLLVATVGISGRTLLQQLKLVKLPRLNLVLVTVVLCLTLAVSWFDHLGWNPGARAVILPMVSLTMMIERFHVTVEEKGYGCGTERLAGTLGVALGCLALFSLPAVQRTFLTFPETEFFVASALMLAGRYRPNGPAAVQIGPEAAPSLRGSATP